MPENDRLGGRLDEINLEFAEREATPKLLMKLSIQLHLPGLSLLNTVYFLRYSVLIGLDLLFVTGYTRPICSRALVGVRIKLRSMKP
jgi:hypothetical protein